MKPCVFTMVSLLLFLGVTFSPSQGALVASTAFIGSTIEEIDLAGLKVTIKTDQGESLSLSVTNAEVMKGLTKGDRVSLELDVQGRVMKIVKTAPNLKIAPDPKG
ncbi:MAG: hypothetical protein ACREI2_02265 [Nitrospiraceae bacterium]